MVQHSHVQDVDLGLHELHGLLGTESRVRGDVAAPWDCPPAKCSGHGVGGKAPCVPPSPCLTHHEAGALQPDRQRVLWGRKLHQWGRMGGRRVAGQEPLAPHLALGLASHRRLQLRQPLLQLRDLGGR